MNPSKRRRADESEQMRLKLAKFIGEVVLKPGCRLRGDCIDKFLPPLLLEKYSGCAPSTLRTDCIEMQCVKCGVWKERTTEYFSKSNGGKSFVTCDPGHETLHNSTIHPCMTCWVSMAAVHNSTTYGYISRMCSKYDYITPK